MLSAKMRYMLLLILSLFLLSQPASSVTMSEIRDLVQAFKQDERGPYQLIRWFYPDGTTRPPRSPWPDREDGLQHALHKDIVIQIQKEHGIYLGQILAGTRNEDFLDAAHQYSRMQQYQLEQFLRLADDGWIFRRAQHYRGAFQAEDEETWGVQYLTWFLSDDAMLASHFFLCRQVVQDIPHQAKDDRLMRIRALAQSISDEFPPFMDVRTKIHGQPDSRDLQAVRDFVSKNTIPSEFSERFTELERLLESLYAEPEAQVLQPYIQNFPSNSWISKQLTRLVQKADRLDIRERSRALSELLWRLRQEMEASTSSAERLTMMDLSLRSEALLLRGIGTWQPKSLGDLIDKVYVLARAVAGCGFVETWEWETLKPVLALPQGARNMPLDRLLERTDRARRAVYWGTGMVRANYASVIALFSQFEPLAHGFIDERIRASVLLSLGGSVSLLSDVVSEQTGTSSWVMDIRNQSEVLGLNAGFAFGELEVVTDPAKDIQFSPKKIYVLQQAPEDMKPVAGVVTVAEGNLVSHVQLLARNLGIPNAQLSSEHLSSLLPFSGQTVFYAVSPRGTVLMKPEASMTADERALVEVRQRSEERIQVPTDTIELERMELVSLADLRASESGHICGPKAANLGELKALFPAKVAPGFIIPFGVFRQHMDQPMPQVGMSYWQFLGETFHQAERARSSGKSAEQIQQAVFKRLAQLRQAIQSMSFQSDFTSQLRRRFSEVFGDEMGRVPVFIRSDTNMEDLRDFTGAGLNLTVPNVLSDKQISQAIRDVWASPFTERSYLWRQKYLLNPENVYPSILILRSVNVQKSGVLITTGVASGDPRDITIAFSRGVGGAVAGQAAETWLLQPGDQERLLAPAREPEYSTLPLTGGIEKRAASFEHPILSPSERHQMRVLTQEIRDRLQAVKGADAQGPFDVELGVLDDSIWLFQVRPFVENKAARSSTYLSSLDVTPPAKKKISLTGTLVQP